MTYFLNFLHMSEASVAIDNMIRDYLFFNVPFFFHLNSTRVILAIQLHVLKINSNILNKLKNYTLFRGRLIIVKIINIYFKKTLHYSISGTTGMVG